MENIKEEIRLADIDNIKFHNEKEFLKYKKNKRDPKARWTRPNINRTTNKEYRFAIRNELNFIRKDKEELLNFTIQRRKISSRVRLFCHCCDNVARGRIK
jgi:3-methyladenine DNA glycosylase Mpg